MCQRAEKGAKNLIVSTWSIWQLAMVKLMKSLKATTVIPLKHR